jgi:antitoxin (DNA-binding transcriptional repressor) of toxin-antitoxin stability system
VITRHNQPVARLGPGHPAEVRHGSRVGTGRLEPAIRRGTKGRYLAVLMDDRGTR